MTRFRLNLTLNQSSLHFGNSLLYKLKALIFQLFLPFCTKKYNKYLKLSCFHGDTRKRKNFPLFTCLYVRSRRVQANSVKLVFSFSKCEAASKLQFSFVNFVFQSLTYIFERRWSFQHGNLLLFQNIAIVFLLQIIK